MRTPKRYPVLMYRGVTLSNQLNILVRATAWKISLAQALEVTVDCANDIACTRGECPIHSSLHRRAKGMVFAILVIHFVGQGTEQSTSLVYDGEQTASFDYDGGTPKVN